MISSGNGKTYWQVGKLASTFGGNRLAIFATTLFAGALMACVGESDPTTNITFIQVSDLHGQFEPQQNPRDNQEEGGLARVYSVISSIRQTNSNTLLFNAGDTIQGSGPVLFTRGQAIVDVLNLFHFDAFVPGNWDFTYGIERYRELFEGLESEEPVAPWGTLSANAYYTGEALETGETPRAGSLVSTPYRVVTVADIKIGIFGCTTNRGPQVVGSHVTQGVSFSNCKGEINTANNPPIKLPNGDTTTVDNEIEKYVDILRNKENVNIVVLLSEAGLGENIFNAENFDGIDVIFSSDMHEETNFPIQVTTPNGGTTLIVEQGEDGAQVGELTVKFKKGQISGWNWIEHDVTNTIEEDSAIARKVASVTAPFTEGSFRPERYPNPYNDTVLAMPLDTVVGYTEVELSRNRYAHEWDEEARVMPAVVEGSAHDLISDAFRHMTGADVGCIRGFRYGTSVPANSDITFGDLFNFLAVGAQVAVGEVTAAQLNNILESAADSAMNPDVSKWAGGWMINFSGLTFDLDPYDRQVLVGGNNPPENTINAGRTYQMQVGRNSVSDATPGMSIGNTDGGKTFTLASYYYDSDPDLVNRFKIAKPETIKKLMRNRATGELELVPMLPPPANIADYDKVDATEVVAAYIEQKLNGIVTAENLPFPRIHLAEALPDVRPAIGFPVMEPLYGMNPARYYPRIPANFQPEDYDED